MPTGHQRRGGTLQDAEEGDGQQYDTDVGPIDILAVEPKSKSFVVIELKKGRSSDQVLGQILRYMGWVKQELCQDGQAVKGLIICGEPDPKLSLPTQLKTRPSRRRQMALPTSTLTAAVHQPKGN